jgi:hypothetical protein
LPGSLEGVVLDDRGTPVSGATISAIGPANAVAVADILGRFRVRSLPPGPYLVRAHLVGYNPSRRQFIDVRPSGRTTVSVAMRRTDGARMLAAGFVSEPAEPDPRAGAPGSRDGAGASGDDQSELAWRLRRLRRSVLKDAADRITLTGADDTAEPGAGFSLPRGFSGLARAVGSSARFASTLVGDLSVTGQFNVLTTGSFDSPVDFLTTEQFSRAVAFLSLHGVAGSHGLWSAQAMMTQGILGAWVVAGEFQARAPATHLYELGMSYAAQRYVAGKGSLSLPSSEGSRGAAVVYGADRWALSPHVTLSYGARYSRYDYIPGPGLFSPAVSLSVVPEARTRIVASLSRRMLAPGAEEFMPPLAVGLWVPPARTFEAWSANHPMSAERTLHYEMGVERDLPAGYVIAVRGFYQRVGDQQAAFFGNGTAQAVLGHYYVGAVGDVDARGWSVGVTNALGPHVRGSVTYEFTAARWAVPGDVAVVALLAPSVVRSPVERFHDVSTSFETDIPRTATRLIVLYKLNTAFCRRDDEGPRPGFDGRFDVQVTQRLPFLDFTSAQWQVLVAVRNLFRDPTQFNSVYDELLVARPPKRIVGGVLVRF